MKKCVIGGSEMVDVQKLMNVAIKIDEFNFIDAEVQVNENYRSLDFYNSLTEEEKEVCNMWYGEDKDLTKIMITKEKVISFIKSCVEYNGFFEAEFDIEEFDLFLKKVIEEENAVYKKILISHQIMYRKGTKTLEFKGYDYEVVLENVHNQKNIFQHIAILELGDGAYIVLPMIERNYQSNDYVTTNVLGKVLKDAYVLDSDLFFEVYEVYNNYRQSHIGEQVLRANLGNLPEMSKAIKLSKDEVFKYRFEKSMNPEFKLHLKIYEVASEYASADKEDASFIYEASKNYNPAIKKIYDLYDEIGKYYFPFMTDADYLILDWIRFMIAINKHNDVLAEQLGLNILKRQSSLRKLPQVFYKYTNYILPLHSGKVELLREFSKYFTDEIVFHLLNYYVKNFRYDDAYVVLKDYDSYFNRYLDDEIDEKYRKYKLKNLEQDAQWDIGLIVADLECTYDEHIANEWAKRIERVTEDFKKSKLDMNGYGTYKRMSQYIGNVIIVMITKEDYETSKGLLNIYNKYLIKDEDYEALERFVLRESEIKTNDNMLKEMLGLFSLEIEGTHKFFNSFYELTSSEMTSELSLSESENRVIELLSKGKGNEYNQCFQLIKNAQEKYIKRMSEENCDYDFYSSYFDNSLRKLTELVKKDPLYEDVERAMKEEYGNSIWIKFTDETRKYLITGRVLCDYLDNKSDSDKFDYSPICLCWARAVESELQKKFFAPIIRAYNNSLSRGNRNIKYPQSSFMESRNQERNNSGRVDIKNYTLGSLEYVCGFNRNSDREDWNRFNEFLRDNVYKTMNDNERRNHIRNLVEKSKKLNYDYRIKAAHPLETISKDELKLCKDIVFQSQELLKLIVKDMDEEWPIKSLVFA